jgi:hypothetical protein
MDWETIITELVICLPGKGTIYNEERILEKI